MLYHVSLKLSLMYIPFPSFLPPQTKQTICDEVQLLPVRGIRHYLFLFILTVDQQCNSGGMWKHYTLLLYLQCNDGCIALPWGVQTLPPGFAPALGMLQSSLTLLVTSIPCLHQLGKSLLLRCCQASPCSAGRIGSPRATGWS